MFKIIFIFMFLFLALASLTTPNHIFLNQFITEHRDTFSSTKTSRDNVSVIFTHITVRQIKKDDTIINVCHCFSDIYGQIKAGHCASDIYGQVIVVHPLECIHLHCCLTLQVSTDKME